LYTNLRKEPIEVEPVNFLLTHLVREVQTDKYPSGKPNVYQDDSLDLVQSRIKRIRFLAKYQKPQNLKRMKKQKIKKAVLNVMNNLTLQETTVIASLHQIRTLLLTHTSRANGIVNDYIGRQMTKSLEFLNGSPTGNATYPT